MAVDRMDPRSALQGRCNFGGATNSLKPRNRGGGVPLMSPKPKQAKGLR